MSKIHYPVLLIIIVEIKSVKQVIHHSDPKIAEMSPFAKKTISNPTKVYKIMSLAVWNLLGSPPEVTRKNPATTTIRGAMTSDAKKMKLMIVFISSSKFLAFRRCRLWDKDRRRLRQAVEEAEAGEEVRRRWL